MAKVIFNGEPGTIWANTTGRVQYQMVVQFIRSCGVCIQFAGAIGSFWPIPFHRGCRCENRPIWPGEMGLPFVDFIQEIRDLDAAQQSIAIGASNWKLIEAGVAKWEDVVTPTRVRDLREVVSRGKLSIEQLRGAGIQKHIAEHAYRTVNTPAHKLAERQRQTLIEALSGKGLSREQIETSFGRRIAERVRIGAGPSGPSPMPPAGPPPTPSKPAPALVVNLGVKPTAIAKPPTVKPVGFPPSKGLSIEDQGHPEYGKKLRATLATIDKLHGTGAIDCQLRNWIPLHVSDLYDLKGATGLTKAAGDWAVRMEMPHDGPHTELSLAHEVGHYLDYGIIPGRDNGRDYATGIFAGWYNAVRNTAAVRQLNVSAENPADASICNYYLSPDELWCRCYAQWVALRSGDPAMLASLDAIRSQPSANLFPRHWWDDDFKPVAKAIDKMFRKLGWMK